MKKKYNRILFTAVGLFIILLICKRPFIYFTGIGTELSYFKARSTGVKDGVLVFYIDFLPNYIGGYKVDSLQRSYGFTTSTCLDLSHTALEIYNSQIQKELIRRIGPKRWNDYLLKADSLGKAEAEKFLPRKKTQ